MCEPRNNSTYAECWRLILKMTGRKYMTNQEKVRILKEHGGCMQIPISKDGPTIACNIVPACGPCNASKGNREPSVYPALRLML